MLDLLARVQNDADDEVCVVFGHEKHDHRKRIQNTTTYLYYRWRTVLQFELSPFH